MARDKRPSSPSDLENHFRGIMPLVVEQGLAEVNQGLVVIFVLFRARLA